MLNVLIVHNDIYFSKVLINNIMLNNTDLRIKMIATDGEEALDILLNKENNIDIVLLDLNLPKHNGFEILDNLINEGKYNNSIIVILDEPIKKSKIKHNPLIYSLINRNAGIENIVKEIIGLKRLKQNEKNFLKDKYYTKQKITKELMYIGYNPKYKGTKYLVETIFLVNVKKENKFPRLEKDIYPILSKKYNKSVNTIKCDIIRATNQVKFDAKDTKFKKYFGNFIEEKINPKLVIHTILNKITYDI